MSEDKYRDNDKYRARDPDYKDNDYYEDNKYRDDDESEDDTEEYPINNLIKYLSANKIGIHGIFSYEGRVVFIFVHYIQTGLDLFIYVPSKYYIKVDESVKNFLHISLRKEEEPSVDKSLFINSRYINNRKMIETSFDRIRPLLEDSSCKISYIDKEIMVYIDRHNEGVDSFSFNTPFNRKGFYFIVDLENFYKGGKGLEKEIHNLELLLNTKIYKVYDRELKDLSNTLSDLITSVKNFSGDKQSSTFSSRVKRVNDVIVKNLQNGKTVTDCTQVMSKIREDNFNNIFYYENIIHFLNEIKELK
jgi:hypothetical protein